MGIAVVLYDSFDEAYQQCQETLNACSMLLSVAAKELLDAGRIDTGELRTRIVACQTLLRQAHLRFPAMRLEYDGGLRALADIAPRITKRYMVVLP